jgi:predicted  nucleic acid-binding Zn-ribbon protein
MVRLREKDEVYDNTKHKLDSTKARVQQLEQELSAAQAKQRVAEEAIAGRLANAESRVEELETTVAQLCRERDDALSRLKHLQAECDTLHEQRSQLERQLSESMDRQQQLTGELKSAREELTPFLKLSGVPSSPPSETTTVTEAEGGEQPSSITPQPLPFDQSLRSSG